MEQLCTSQTNLANSVSTSSSTQRSEGSLSEHSWIKEALGRLDATLASKNEDYKIAGEFSNFEFAGQVAGVHPLDVMVTQIGIKLGRLKGLAESPNNEARLDSFKDLAGYAVILYGYALSQTGEQFVHDEEDEDYDEWGEGDDYCEDWDEEEVF